MKYGSLIKTLVLIHGIKIKFKLSAFASNKQEKVQIGVCFINPYQN